MLVWEQQLRRANFTLIHIIGIVFCVCLCWQEAYAQSTEPYLVKDIAPGSASSDPFDMVAAEHLLYFTIFNRDHLWRSDGTDTGTWLLKSFDKQEGARPLTTVGDVLYFVGEDSTHGRELWKSDGTVAGTVLVKDICPGACSSTPGMGTYPIGMAVLNGSVYFNAYDGVNGTELWRSDGTESGTILVKDINPGDYGSAPIWIIAVNKTLYFSAFHAKYGRELWRSDGTAAGTMLVKDVDPAKFDSINLMVGATTNGTIYLVSGTKIWKSDGTKDGTVLVKEIDQGNSDWRVLEWAATGNKFYLCLENNTTSAVWVTDGTSDGTRKVKDPAGNLIRMEDVIYFSAREEATGAELWKTDGTEAGTVLVKDIYTGPKTSYVTEMTVANGLLYFYATSETTGNELWQSDGTEAGTHIVKDLYSGPNGSAIRHPSIEMANDILYFTAGPFTTGDELWGLNFRPYHVFLPSIY